MASHPGKGKRRSSIGIVVIADCTIASAAGNDVNLLRMLETYAAIQEMKERLDKLGLTYEVFVNPQTVLQETPADGMYTSVARITEEAWMISIGVNTCYLEIPWDDIASIRHNLVHYYPGVLSEHVWNAMTSGMAALEEMARDYCFQRVLELPERTRRRDRGCQLLEAFEDWLFEDDVAAMIALASFINRRAISADSLACSYLLRLHVHRKFTKSSKQRGAGLHGHSISTLSVKTFVIRDVGVCAVRHER